MCHTHIETKGVNLWKKVRQTTGSFIGGIQGGRLVVFLSSPNWISEDRPRESSGPIPDDNLSGQEIRDRNVQKGCSLLCRNRGRRVTRLQVTGRQDGSNSGRRLTGVKETHRGIPLTSEMTETFFDFHRYLRWCPWYNHNVTSGEGIFLSLVPSGR